MARGQNSGHRVKSLVVWIYHAGLCRHADFPQSSLHFSCCVPDLNGTDRKVSEIDAIGAGQLVLRRHSGSQAQTGQTQTGRPHHRGIRPQQAAGTEQDVYVRGRPPVIGSGYRNSKQRSLKNADTIRPTPAKTLWFGLCICVKNMYRICQARRAAASVKRCSKGLGCYPNKQKLRFPATPGTVVLSVCIYKRPACPVAHCCCFRRLSTKFSPKPLTGTSVCATIMGFPLRR